jgi:hypothetical protein
MSQCFNIVYLAGGSSHALNDVLQLKANGLAFPSLSSRRTIGIPPGASPDFLGVGVKLYAICF